ncbi:CgeB family protein [Occallatibacter riparius]|uniref:Glycosyltransferase n=1 Tax=Occallatibacter riparius TaxID=1002689 RepID=A0A9J7BVQ8_9BACT|nr:glycosyltransferase [Occallatibacter riparius]UWZ86955.1 glycosyltransferase [Occallatibacter riparius]
MHVVIFGLTVSSSWGNGHATLWRGFLKAMSRRGHTATFYERDVPYYAATRDGWEAPPGIALKLFDSFENIQAEAARELARADVALVTSYCGDGDAASRLVLDSRAQVRAFYDLDTPVTLDTLRIGARVAYLPAEGLSEFDIVLSYTGGRALEELTGRLGARAVAPLYGWVDPEMHFPVPPCEEYRSALSYLGTYADDRQQMLEELFVIPARRLPEERFLIGGAQYPSSFPWSQNIFFVSHMPPSLHPAFFSSSRFTLNVTRRAMAEYGFCPSGRIFEAAACGTPLISDTWSGLETFLQPDVEILTASTSADVVRALSLSDVEHMRIAEAARARVLAHHTAEQRVAEFESICQSIATASPPIPEMAEG